jgi:hypothetical protein
LRRNSFGRLELTDADGETHDGVVPVRAFPITAPDDGIALVDPYGHELAWIDRLDDLPDDLRSLLEANWPNASSCRNQRIVSVASFATPSTWQVETDRGGDAFVLKGEEDIRRLARRPADRRQSRHPLPDPRPQALDQHSRTDSRPLPVSRRRQFSLPRSADCCVPRYAARVRHLAPAASPLGLPPARADAHPPFPCLD